MKPPDFDKFFFRLNVLATMLVFVLIIPTTRIFSSWYPRDKRLLWFIPVCIIMLSMMSWFFVSLLTPWFFRKGFFDERRHDDASARYQGMARFKKRLMPILNLMTHVVLIVLFCYLMVTVMQGEGLGKLLFFKAGE